MNVDTRGLQSSGVDDSPPPLQAFPPRGQVWRRFYQEREHIPRGRLFRHFSTKTVGRYGTPVVLDLTSVRSNVGPC
jgi:hypothetical protein